MKRTRWTSLLVGLGLVGLLVACGGPTPQVQGSPQETVSAFYAWYDSVEGNPLNARAYHEAGYLSQEFAEEIDALVDSFEELGGGFDPFICAQDRPPEITVVAAEGTPDLTRVTVEAWAPIYVDVQLIDWEWKIIAIHCTPPGDEAANAPQPPQEPVAGEPATATPAPMEPTPVSPEPAEPTLASPDPVEPTAEAPAANDPTPEVGSPVADIPADWSLYEDGECGFSFWYPGDWEAEELRRPAGAEVAPGEKARLYSVLLQPGGWDGVAAPVNVEVTEGTEEEFALLYPPPTSTEEVVINGYPALKTTASFGTVFITRYIVPSPANADIRIVCQDMLSGFPDRVAGNEDISATIEQICGTIEFGE